MEDHLLTIVEERLKADGADQHNWSLFVSRAFARALAPARFAPASNFAAGLLTRAARGRNGGRPRGAPIIPGSDWDPGFDMTGDLDCVPRDLGVVAGPMSTVVLNAESRTPSRPARSRLPRCVVGACVSRGRGLASLKPTSGRARDQGCVHSHLASGFEADRPQPGAVVQVVLAEVAPTA